MPTIYDNIQNQFADGLADTLEVSYRSDFCVGYFNLRGWKQVADYIEKWSGNENNRCRLLIGMYTPPNEILFKYFSQSEDEIIDNKKANNLKKELAQHFREQLTLGIPTEEDEIGLRKLSKQIREGKVVIKFFLKHPLHAKLYLCFRNDKLSPIIGFVGSSNLTFAG
ncbi:MAG: phospholipase D-like domain-containing protein, partial [Ignavibacteria bacterium]|nr:phospholipase D-like domain-containing protein [Ignavibacteria bacterium]